MCCEKLSISQDEDVIFCKTGCGTSVEVFKVEIGCPFRIEECQLTYQLCNTRKTSIKLIPIYMVVCNKLI